MKREKKPKWNIKETDWFANWWLSNFVTIYFTIRKTNRNFKCGIANKCHQNVIRRMTREYNIVVLHNA